jgi:alkylation response protein AidB-like acyl-CoA dehydrogenase
MDFDLTDEQRLLSESVTRFVAERYGFEERLRILKAPEGWSREIWKEMADLGLLGIPFAEEDGGFGAGGVETMLVMDALGRGLSLEPYLSTVILAGGALRLAGTRKQKDQRIAGIIAGERILALAHSEPRSLRHSLEARGTVARRQGDNWHLDGEKIAVLHGASADEFVLSARTDLGTTLFLVAGDAPGLRRQAQRGYDGIPIASLSLDAVKLGDEALLGVEGAGAVILERLFEEANAALAAEAVGVMADTLDLTTDYLKTRQQFGVPIGSFQALQHRAVDMLIELELARSMAMLAALSLDASPEERRRNIAAAKIQIGRSGRFIGQQAVQMHGAIGITAEYKVGHAFKRLTAIDALFGDADHHVDALADAGGLVRVEAEGLTAAERSGAGSAVDGARPMLQPAGEGGGL